MIVFAHSVVFGVSQLLTHPTLFIWDGKSLH